MSGSQHVFIIIGITGITIGITGIYIIIGTTSIQLQCG